MKRTIVLLILMTAVSTFFTMPIMASSSVMVPVLVQAADVETAAQIVTDYGGRLNEQLAIINAVSADVTARSMEAIAADSRTVAVHNDNMVEIAGHRTIRKSLSADFPQVMGADEAWDENIKGDEIGIAIVDTGIANFSWNRRRILERYDTLDDGSRRQDPNGHGTMMASLAGNSAPGILHLPILVEEIA